MKTQNQCCTLEQAKLLKSLGVSQESLFSWCGDETKRLMDNGKDGLAVSDWVYIDSTIPANNQEADHRSMVPSAKPFASAFTVAELYIMLPDYYPSWRFKVNEKSGERKWVATVICGPKPPGVDDIHTAHEFDRYAKTQAEALATLLIALLETEVIAVEEANARLCAE